MLDMRLNQSQIETVACLLASWAQGPKTKRKAVGKHGAQKTRGSFGPTKVGALRRAVAMYKSTDGFHLRVP